MPSREASKFIIELTADGDLTGNARQLLCFNSASLPVKGGTVLVLKSKGNDGKPTHWFTMFLSPQPLIRPTNNFPRQKWISAIFPVCKFQFDVR